MSIFDENIEPKFEDLLESLDWFKAVRYRGSISYTYSGMDCEDRYFSIEFFPKGYIFYEDYDKSIAQRSHKDRWHIYYQQVYHSISTGDPYYMGISCDIRMNRENVIQLMNDIKNRTFNPRNYKVIKR